MEEDKGKEEERKGEVGSVRITSKKSPANNKVHLSSWAVFSVPSFSVSSDEGFRCTIPLID